jgi:hypothetical protein
MKVPNTKENNNDCLCPNCPTYNECMMDKKINLFCSTGKSECKIDRQGCLCGECPVASRYGLNKLYFCDKSE